MYCCWDGVQQGSSRLFSVVSKKTRDTSKELNLYLRKSFYRVGVTEHCNRFPREVVESLSLDIFKTQLDMALSNSLWLTLPWAGGAGLEKYQKCLPTSVILWFSIIGKINWNLHRTQFLTKFCSTIEISWPVPWSREIPASQKSSSFTSPSWKACLWKDQTHLVS